MNIETLANLNHADWRRIATRELARPEARLFIDGAYADAVGGGRFEGCRQSGNTRDKCVGSLLSYTRTRSAWIRLG